MSSNSHPLQGLSIALTRPKEQAEGLSSTLQALGAQVYSLPTISIRYLPPSSQQGPQWLAASHERRSLALISSVAARAFAHHLSTSYTNIQIPAWNHIYVIGNQTLKVTESLNFQCKTSYVAVPQNDEGLQTLIRNHHDKSEIIVAPRGNLARLKWSDRLGADGFRIQRPEVYETSDAIPTLMNVTKPIDLILFFSPSAVRAWKRVYPNLTMLGCAAIGQTTAQACRDEGLPLRVIAAEPSEDSLRESVVDYVVSERR